MRKYDGAEKVEWPAKVKETEDPTIGQYQFCTIAEEQNALKRGV